MENNAQMMQKKPYLENFAHDLTELELKKHQIIDMVVGSSIR